MGEGTTTDWTGFPSSGKTVLLLNFLVLASKRHGWRHVIYMPDAGTEAEVLADVINIAAKKSFLYKPKISDKEIHYWAEWVQYHFLILKKSDIKARITPYAFGAEAAAFASARDMVKTVTLDAWKDLFHDDSRYKRHDIYLEDVLSYRNKVAEESGLHIHTVIHPTKPQRDVDGKIKPPSGYDLKGGSEWYNNAKNIVTVHRPDRESNLVEFYTRKIKPRSLGQMGRVGFWFDYRTYNYYYIDEGGREIFLDGEIRNEKPLAEKNEQGIETDLPF
jgi:hypothetical protein